MDISSSIRHTGILSSSERWEVFFFPQVVLETHDSGLFLAGSLFFDRSMYMYKLPARVNFRAMLAKHNLREAESSSFPSCNIWRFVGWVEGEIGFTFIIK
jgi:hypothetical protein